MIEFRAIPRWIRLAFAGIFLGEAAALPLLLFRHMSASHRNLVILAQLGAGALFVILCAYLLRFHPDVLRPVPSRIGIGLLIVLALGLVLLYVLRAWPYLTLPYDLASWSEPGFVSAIIKWRTGTPLYLSPDDSHSSPYPPGAPAVTYFFAWLLGHPTSIVCFRLIQQAYLIAAALFAASSTRQLVLLAAPERVATIPWRLWRLFFFLASLLFAAAPSTNSFNIFLHIDPLGLLTSSVSFWLLTSYSLSEDPRWLFPMAAMPGLAFLVKQYLVIWMGVYLLYLWLQGNLPWRKIADFAAASFAVLAATLAACFAAWGSAFRFWVFEIFSRHEVSWRQIGNRFADGSACILLGVLGGFVLIRGANFYRLLGIWIGWLVMLFGALYSAGITFHPTHFGPATIVAGCFLLAGLAVLWPAPEDDIESRRPQQWMQLSSALLAVFLIFVALDATRLPARQNLADLYRYVGEIEREVAGLPSGRALIDSGEWINLRQGVVMKDRSDGVLVVALEAPFSGLVQRVREQAYDRILVRQLRDSSFSYDSDRAGRVKKELLANYHEVRRISAVRGLDAWLYHALMLADLIVLEPNSRPQDSPPPSAAADTTPKVPGGKN